MLLLFGGYLKPAEYVFAVSLVFLLLALCIAFREVTMSAKALAIELSNIQEEDVITKE